MTTRLALILAALIAAFFVLDHVWLHLDAPLVLSRKFVQFLEWVAFWR